MAVLGRACLILALAAAVYGIGASVYGARAGRREFVVSGRRAVYTLFGLLTVAFAVLEVAFVTSDFSFKTVWDTSSTTTPLFYRITAVWASQEGSLLLWVWLLSGWSSLVLFLNRRKLRDVAPYATAILCAFATFFTSLLVFMVSPFDVLNLVPAEGLGLNPLLRHPSMMVHPPMLYSGYTLFTVPFAFAAGALIVRRVDAEWIRAIRRFALTAWLFLGVGILLGARWSYTELDWGGYWGWDAVENAALLPWLTGTAFVHSVMIQEKRGMLKRWNVSLILGTGILAILGTFLVRSGILSSIHAFGQSTVGGPFLALIIAMIVAAIALVYTRWPLLKTEHQLDSLLSRESFFLLNNLLLVGLAFVVFWGTFFPLISEALTGSKASVGPPWFDRYTVPLALGLVLLTGIGPVIAWRRATAANLKRHLTLPLAAGMVALVALLLAVPGMSGRTTALIMFCFAAFALAVTAQELWRGARARRAMTGEPPPLALLSLVRRNRRRYGGYIVHAGIAVLFVGVAASSSFMHQRQVRLDVGQSAKVGAYTFRYVSPAASLTAQKISLGAHIAISEDGHHVANMTTMRGYYPTPAPMVGLLARYFTDGEPETAVGLKAGWWRDLWSAVQPDLKPMQKLIRKGDQVARGQSPRVQAIVLGSVVQHYLKDPPPATFNLLVSPLVTWLWIGGIIAAAGGLIALWPSPELAVGRVRAGYAARVARELGRA